MKKFLALGISLILVIVYYMGPKPAKPSWDYTLPTVPSEAVALEKYIADKESKHKIKPDNEARIIWKDSTKTKTKYAVVYLHGFSASQKEGDPIHRDFAKAFGCNLFLTRLADHGIDTTEALLNFTVERYWKSVKEALAIGKVIGDHVILMGTSTGGTAALILAAQYPDDVYALINMSPNIAINNNAAFLLNNPWGLQIARLVVGGKYNISEMEDVRKQYWNSQYRMEATTQLQELLEEKMNAETFKKVKQPVLTLYYYKNEQEQDPLVKVSAMLEMHQQLGTPDSLKVAVAVPNAGAHVIGSYLTSKDVKGVYHEIEKFAIEKLHLKKVQ